MEIFQYVSSTNVKTEPYLYVKKFSHYCVKYIYINKGNIVGNIILKFLISVFMEITSWD